MCKLAGAEINYYNATILVDQNYGRSLIDPSQVFVSAKEGLYNFMTYPSNSIFYIYYIIILTFKILKSIKKPSITYLAIVAVAWDRLSLQ